MKIFLVLPLVLASCYGQYIVNPWGTTLVNSWDPRIWNAGLIAPRVLSTPIVQQVAPIAIPTSSQYHAQDELGQFAFGHRGDNQARDEVKSFDGSVRGAYSYVDPTGKLVNVQYLADHNGFRVLGANNLPIAPALPAPIELKGPEPVQDTPEVIAARADFEKKFLEVAKEAEKEPEPAEEKKEEEGKSRKKRQILFPSLYSAPLWNHQVLATPYISTVPVAPVVPLAKTIVKTAELKPIEDAKTPASTKSAEIEEKKHEIVSPLGSWILPQTRTIVLSKDEKKEIFSPLPLTHSTILL